MQLTLQYISKRGREVSIAAYDCAGFGFTSRWALTVFVRFTYLLQAMVGISNSTLNAATIPS